ncbi:MAG TPA: hypothetical protein VFZ78_11580 [Flavisolibacter sp.]
MYSVGVKIEGIESRRRSAGLLHIVIAFFLMVNARNYLVQTGYANMGLMVPVFIVALISGLYGIFRRSIDITARYNYWMRLLQVVTFALMGFAWIGTGRTIDYIAIFIFSFLCILLMFSERRIFQETAITMDEKGLHIPGYYREHLVKWHEISEVVVREDFLTIFHVRQKYLQYQVKQDLSTLEVAKMNAFCKEMIEQVQTPSTAE